MWPLLGTYFYPFLLNTYLLFILFSNFEQTYYQILNAKFLFLSNKVLLFICEFHKKSNYRSPRNYHNLQSISQEHKNWGKLGTLVNTSVILRDLGVIQRILSWEYNEMQRNEFQFRYRHFTRKGYRTSFQCKNQISQKF